ncbi:hypothetical protein ERJ75_000044600 [Trypanosoma vivax]|uniref:Uncharacterized protein n=1 Tax=Trypanosoma vivax (strain Y486) TaxID=1055687 RepID=G0U7E2_TRYVY|nr:hypothetical protein TRVL_06341 [Trypanosoma vivax]KAH8620539.1 hypothetical protein ERJ75_000044600 [Trypanosoma vivax]CCC51800.1 conserved hypothetical protein [Trypanosoma vivax Y486]
MLRRLVGLWGINPLFHTIGAARLAGGSALRTAGRVRLRVPTSSRERVGATVPTPVRRVAAKRGDGRIEAAPAEKTRKRNASVTPPRVKAREPVRRGVTEKRRRHAHTVQKIKYNKRVAAIAKLWRQQKKRVNKPPTSASRR